MAPVSIKNVGKNYGNVTVMQDVSIEIADGEFVVLVGPSGCGKSTLLRMIAGLEDINSGTISIADKVVNGLPPKQRDISMVFQNYALYPHMTVAENMAFSLTLAKASAEEKKRKVAEAADILGLTPLLERYPRHLSGGQRQRVAMGRSIVRNPQVFLFDEPLSNLDAKLRVAMRAEIKALHKRLGTTIIYVTHDQVEAITMADKIVVLQGGHVEQIGAPLDLYDNPANSFVGQFIGSPSMNLLKAKRAGDYLVLENELSTNLPAPVSLEEGQYVFIGKRPEHMAFAQNGVEGLTVSVNVVEPTGSELFVVAQQAGVELTCVFRDRLSIRDGDLLNLDFTQGPVHYFDVQTCDRLMP